MKYRKVLPVSHNHLQPSQAKPKYCSETEISPEFNGLWLGAVTACYK
jgi:hypothetical protein